MLAALTLLTPKVKKRQHLGEMKIGSTAKKALIAVTLSTPGKVHTEESISTGDAYHLTILAVYYYQHPSNT